MDYCDKPRGLISFCSSARPVMPENDDAMSYSLCIEHDDDCAKTVSMGCQKTKARKLDRPKEGEIISQCNYSA